MKSALLPFALLALAAPISCHEKASAQPDPSPAAAAKPAIASASSTPSAASGPKGIASTSATASDSGAYAGMTTRVSAFFAGYKDGSDFGFLREWCASPVEQFITMKNADIGAVITSARRFFADKRGVGYHPDLKALQVSQGKGGDVVKVPLTMVWGTLPPEDWTANDPASDVPDAHRALPDGVGAEPRWSNLVEHTTTVDVELTFDAQGHLTRYTEGPPRRAKLKFHADEACLDTFGFATSRPDGDVVTDLGEVYITDNSPKGPQVARHVRLRSGEDAWVQDTRSYEVGNPFGGTSAGVSECLVPVDRK